MRKGIKLAALLLTAMMLAGCAQKAEREAPQLLEPVGVQSDMAAAYIGDIYKTTYYNASIKPYVEELSFKVSGEVMSVNGYPGMTVEEGDVLIELDQDSLRERAEQLQQELNYMQQDNKYADTIAELDIQILQTELQQLTEQGGSEQEIALKENEIAQKQAQLRQNKALRAPELESKRKELEALSVSLNENVMRAPFAGRIIYGDMLMPGSWVNADDPVVFLADDSKLSIVCDYISESTIQMADRIYAYIGDKEYEVEYQPIDPEEFVALALSGATLTTTFEIVASEEELAALEAGQYVAVCLWSNYVPDALLVPSGAVMRESAGRYVYVDENGSRVKRMVKIGKQTDGLVQIVEGLEEGEVVYVKD